MMTGTLEVGDLFLSLGAHGIERQLQRVVGIGRVSVNPVSGSTTFVYDPEKTSFSAIQEARRLQLSLCGRSPAQACL
jgi:P-type Cu2+ transporter